MRYLLHGALALALFCAPAHAQETQGTSPQSIIKGGTGASTAAGARINLGIMPASVKDYGAAGSVQSTNGTVNALSPTLTLTGAIDFKNGQGVYVHGAGAATSIGTPTLSAVVPVNSTGATTYAYKIASKSNNGGIKAATAAVTISNGAATLGTYLSGIGGIAMNQITWVQGSGSLCTIVWRSKSGGAYQQLGCFTGTAIYDSGLPTQGMFGVPTLPPGADTPDALVTTIVSGAGTSTLTLAVPAATSVVGQFVTHDDSAAIIAAGAANATLYFPAGNYYGRDLKLPSNVTGVYGDGSSVSIVNAYGQTTDGLTAAMSASPAGAQFTMDGMKINAVLSMAFDGFALDTSTAPVIKNSQFFGATALHVKNSINSIIGANNHIYGWWNIGIFSDGNTADMVDGNIVGGIAGQAGGVAISAAPAGSNYAFGTGLFVVNATGHSVKNNQITMAGGAFGIWMAAPNGTVTDNDVFYTGRECIATGGVLATAFKASGNYCYWISAGNGNLSGYDYGISMNDDGVHPLSNGDVSGNSLISPGFSAVGLVGSGAAGAPYTNVTITNNSISGSNQLGVHTCGIELSGSNVSGITVANNTNQSVTANMTYNVCEQDQGLGAPNNNRVSLPLGVAGSSGYVNLLGAGSQSYLLPSHTGQLATLAGTETFTSKSMSGSANTFSNIPNSALSTPAPCSAFGIIAGTCVQGGVIASTGPIGSATVAPIVTVNTAGQVTALGSATITPAVGSLTGAGTGALTALGINVGSAGSFVTNGGALGTPSSGTATNLTGLPISSGVAGLGTGVATALGVNVGSAGAPVVNGGALGTPSSGVGTNLTGTASGLTAGNVTTNANLTGPVTSVGNATSIGANQVTRSMESQGAARSVVGVTGNATANVADIQGATDQVLRVNGAGTALAFGAIDISKAAAVTGALAKANGGCGVTGGSTWTPTLTFGGGSTGITYLTRTGNYTQCGDVLTATANIVLTSKGSSTGVASLSGLPASCATTIGSAAISFYASMSGMSAATAAATGTAINLYNATATGSTSLLDTNFTNTTSLNVTAVCNLN